MDIVTHGLAGALVGLAAGRSSARWGTVAAVAGAFAPDTDALARLWDPLAPVTVHRIVTHSLVGGLPLALAVGAIFRLARAPAPLGSLVAVAYAGVLSHVALDLLNPFGTAVFWPFERRRLRLAGYT
jgi:inner membrane protein